MADFSEGALKEPDSIPLVRADLVDLGVMAYDSAFALQTRLINEQIAGTRGPVVLFVEHPPTITVSRRSSSDEVLAPRAVLERRGITVAETDRGGQVTYHGPGQLVVYPLVHLPSLGLGVHEYLRGLEQAVIDYVTTLGLKPFRWEGRTGVWVGKEKVCAMGIRVRRWWTMHGLALNVTTDLNHFGLIVPCGIRDRGVTSLEKILGEAGPTMEDVKRGMTRTLGTCLNVTLTPAGIDSLGG